jgi:predicted ATP-grasp superfamily ATP-dependent carboligase
MREKSGEILVQDYLTGQDVGAAIVMDENSRPVDFILYVSHREYPLSGGPTCLCETVFNRDLLKYASAILTQLKFQGIAMLDFKGSPEKPYLLEINPRIWGSAGLCHVSGSTFFQSYVKAAMGTAEPLDLDTCEPNYQVGARMKFVPHCFLAALSLMKKGRAGEALKDLGAALSPKVKDGLALRGDNSPFRRYMINLFSGKE